ncbi:hypothetical protein C8R45DRAFT_1218279 [Mycena sanguinolenta]|nr:hypothetical protein C8R45DRAFT_1218279 [Mycena sanguinolenta]
MSVIPRELLEAIVDKIHDVESLKACSLAASTLRYSSQRRLLGALTIGAGICAPPYIHQLLTESPHIADYVTRLSIPILPAVMEFQSFPRILAKLQNVRECTMGERTRESQRFTIPPFVLDFLARPSLREVHLSGFQITTSELRHFLTTLSSLHLSFVVIKGGADPSFMHGSVGPAAAVLGSLSLGIGVGEIGEFLVQPANISCLAAVRRLSLYSAGDISTGSSGDRWTRPLIQFTSPTIEHLHLNCAYFPPPALPGLPALRTLKITFSGRINAASLSDIISRTADILPSLAAPQVSPALADIVIEQNLASFDTGTFDPLPYAPLISILDAAQAVYATPPSVRFLLSEYKETQYKFARFADTVQQGMPRAHGAGRLVVEACSGTGLKFRI